MKIVNLLQLSFLPRSVDLGLLVLRLWLGLSLVLLHGWSKLIGFAEMSAKFPDPLGVSSPASLALVVFAEVVCALLLAIGLFTRAAALSLIINMGVAFFIAHNATLKGPKSGELAYIYLAAFVALFIAGAGRFSIDAKLSRNGGR